MINQSYGFMEQSHNTHRTEAATTDHELHAAYERIVRRSIDKAGAHDLLPILFGDEA